MRVDPIRRIGTYQEPDEHGFLRGIGKEGRIGERWARAVQMLVACYQEKWGQELHSVYIRGSVAKGLAIDGVSDLDSLAVLVPGAPTSTDDLSLDDWATEVEVSIQQSFPFVAGVELDPIRFDAALDRTLIDPFLLKVQSVCVHGEDLAEVIQPYVLGPEVAFQTRYFRGNLEQFANDYASEPEADKADFLVWMLRRFLRLGMELVMVAEARYTRDLYLCYESFARHYPAEADRMYRALELAVNPIASRESEAFVLTFGDWLVREACRKLEAWNLEKFPPVPGE